MTRLLQALIDFSPHLLGALDPQFRFLAFNEVFARAFEGVYGRRPTLGASMLELLAHVPDEQRRVRAAWGRALSGEEYDFAQEFGDQALARRVFEVRFKTIRDEGGEVLAAYQIVRDVTDDQLIANAVRAEEALAGFFDSSPMSMGIVELTDGDLLHIRDNQRSAEFFGVAPGETERKLASELGVPREVRDRWRVHYLEAQRTRQPVRFDYWRDTGADVRHHSVTVSFLGKGPTGAPRFSYVIDDTTQQKRTEQQLVASQTELEERVRERTAELQSAITVRDEFLTVASHELRTPLTALALQLERLARLVASTAGAATEHALLGPLAVAVRQAGRLETLIEGLLNVSRITAGPTQLYTGAFDLRDLVRDTVERIAELASRANCELRLRLGEEAHGRWDRERLDEVLMNLLTNAIKYGAGKPIDLSLTADPSQVTVRVVDRGIGIEPDAQQRIFERFERAVPTKNFGGLGLGLYIARQIVHAHGRPRGRARRRERPWRGRHVHRAAAPRPARRSDPHSFAVRAARHLGARPDRVRERPESRRSSRREGCSGSRRCRRWRRRWSPWCRWRSR